MSEERAGARSHPSTPKIIGANGSLEVEDLWQLLAPVWHLCRSSIPTTVQWPGANAAANKLFSHRRVDSKTPSDVNRHPNSSRHDCGPSTSEDYRPTSINFQV